jgi:hypothetical protein
MFNDCHVAARWMFSKKCALCARFLNWQCKGLAKKGVWIEAA